MIIKIMKQKMISLRCIASLVLWPFMLTYGTITWYGLVHDPEVTITSASFTTLSTTSLQNDQKFPPKAILTCP